MSPNQGCIYHDRVRPENAGVSILDYHTTHFRHSTREQWLQAIDRGAIRINQRIATADELVHTGDELEYHRLPWNEPEATLTFRVVHEDPHVLVVDKPAGLQVLPAGGFLVHTLWHQVRASAPSRADAAPVHRLGRGTSGLVLFGKTSAARAELSRQFRERTPCKTYLALVEGVDLPTSCIARHPIGKVRHGPLTIYAATEVGKESTTRIRVLRRDVSTRRSLVAAQPITGRADQIRIHLAACGAPIVGDPLFGPGGVAIGNVPPGAGGYLLHAAGLRFVHPHMHASVKLRSSPPWAWSV